MVLTYEEFQERVKTEGVEWALSFVEKRRKRQGYIRRSNQRRARVHAEENRQWREAHTEYMRRWHLAHLGYMRRYMCQYYREHLEVYRDAVRRRRALKAGSDGNFTGEEFKLLCEAFENRCIYCHRELPLVADHATPLVRGGSDNIDNIVPACVSCNSAKHDKTFDEFVVWLYRVEVGSES